MNRAFYRHERVRMLTLTSSLISDYGKISSNFNAFTKRVRRKFGKFEYFRLFTNEGNGVLHILYRGSYIPHKWVKRAWNELHSAYIVHLREVRRGPKGIAGYIVGRYLSKHNVSWMRSSSSWGWCFKGFVGYFKECLYRNGFHEGLYIWDLSLRYSDPIEFLKSVRFKIKNLRGGGIPTATLSDFRGFPQ